MTASINARRPHRRLDDRIEFKLLFGVVFTVFLLAALVGRLVPWVKPAETAQAERHSPVAEAKAAAGICVPYAFMA